MKETINHYALTNKPVPGRKCRVMVDQRTPEYVGGRYVRGIIRDVYRDIVTVEITDPRHTDYQVHSQLFFPRFAVWSFAEQTEEQLRLF